MFRDRSLDIVLAVALLAGCSTPPGPPPREPSIAVRSEVVEEAPFQGRLTVIGVVRPAELVPLVAVHGGRLRYGERFPDGLRAGVVVAEGAILAVVENETLEHAVVESRLEAESAEAEFDRVRRGYEAGIVAEAEFAAQRSRTRVARGRHESAIRQAERLTVRAPRAGRLIVDEPVAPGTEISAGTVLAELAAEGRPLVEGWAAASDRERLRPGQSIRCVPRGAAAASCRGVVREVAPVVDSAGTLRIVAEVTEPAGLPAPGEGVAVEVELTSREDALSVPEEALVVTDGGHGLFVLSPRGAEYSARRVNVETGDRADGRIEIRAGLRPGDRVAVAGVTLLSDGASAVEAPRDDDGDQAANVDAAAGEGR